MDRKKEEKKAEITSEMVTLGPNSICSDHRFTYISGLEVKCSNCFLGYQMSPEAILKDGHIYIRDQLLI